jgi:UDP-N-acetylmuramoyl-L-alanyl-D-glutamate--2,6-diaminopimelate ligase
MTITELIEGLEVKKKYGPLNKQIKGITYDSRSVEEDFLFVAVKGFTVDGHDYIEDALSRGAAAVIAENAVAIESARQSTNEVAFIEASDCREAMALVSSAFYGHPSGKLSLIGITGTNGKTTTSFITKSILNAGSANTGLLGTISYMTGDKTAAAANTTPESMDLHRLLGEMVDNNMEYAVLEVSSHALALKRIEGCSFNVAAFTSFSQDHLDFHVSMDEYFGAKERLFEYLDEGGTAVLNWDDPMIRPLAKRLDCNVITCGIEDGAMVRAENISEKITSKDHGPGIPSGMTFDVNTPESRFTVNSSFVGRFNVYNILMSIGIARALNIHEEAIKKGIENTEPVNGRFECIDEGQDFLCVIDYAHTEDALIKCIQEARQITGGRVITVFGCGGDRDRTKRPLMGAAASELSDLVIVTSDNPRTETPGGIAEEIIKGMKRNNYTLQLDRAEAVKTAVSLAQPGDTVVLAGKGHEDYQEINGIRNLFSDKEVLREALIKLAKGRDVC